MYTKYEKAARERYEELRTSIEHVQHHAQTERRDLTADELAEVRRYGGEAKELATRIEGMVEDREREEATREMAAKISDPDQETAINLATGRAHEASTRARFGAPSLLPTRAQSAALWRSAEQGGNVSLRIGDEIPDHLRALVTTSDTGLPSGEASMGRATARRLVEAAGIPRSATQGVRDVVFPVFGSGSAGLADEGSTKDEYDAISEGRATPQIIAVWTDFTMQAVGSLDSFEARLRAKHAAIMARREDELVVSSVLATSGIDTYEAGTGDAYSESLLAAAAQVMASDAAAEPNLAVVNPADVRRIFGGSTGDNGETPESRMRLSVHGMTVYPTSAVDEGKALVGAWPAVSSWVVGMDPVVKIDAMSGIKTNVITLLTEEAVALAIDEPSGFVDVTLTDPA